MNIKEKKSIKSNIRKNRFDLKKLKIRRRGWPRSPTVTYDGKPLKSQHRLAGARYLFFYKRMVIKIEEGSERWQTQGEIEFFDNVKRKDAKYFPDLISSDLKRGIIVESFVPMETPTRRPKKVRRLVEKLKEKYTISDLDSEFNHNWALRRGTKEPIIFDVGGYGMGGSSNYSLSSS